MLEVVNLTKIYQSKKGTAVHALDGITLRFPETGMVFLLGKSGSGKSTLLNVCGGLDEPTGGEVIVKGRSSKDFTQSDFDSYRNTFVGFIFQEYNILDEFSVEDNIALALELQGKPKDKATINALLEEVDLTGFAKRKPNTLSGGQKQRIAIARALVKAPEIIMADEPTGALDSNTGKQVFDTLKKLSRDKLVIIVSHDRDFAEQYADRIIELKDGKVLSDLSKTELEQQALSANVNTLGDLLCVKRGKELGDADFETIKNFLKQTSGDVIIAGNQADVETFKKVSRINDDGGKEVFCDTLPDTTPARQYSKEESRFIRSKMPIRHAVKIGLSGLKSKPFRLFLTVLLCTVAFILFGLLSTLNFYNSEATFRQSFQDSDQSIFKLEKKYRSDVIWYADGAVDYEYEAYDNGLFGKKELNQYVEQFGKSAFGGVLTAESFAVRGAQPTYWQNIVNAFAYLPEDHPMRKNINGSYPTKSDELLISSYLADFLVACDTYNTKGERVNFDNTESIIGKQITISGVEYKVTGIFDSGEIDPKYEIYKEDQEVSEQDQYTYRCMLEDGLHLTVFGNMELIETVSADNLPYSYDNDSDRNITVYLSSNQNPALEYSNALYRNATDMAGNQNYLAIGNKTMPGEKEAVISACLFGSLIEEQLREMSNGELSDSMRQKITDAMELAGEVRGGERWTYPENGGDPTVKKLNQAELNDAVKQLIRAVETFKIDLNVTFRLYNRDQNSVAGDPYSYAVVGVNTLLADLENYESYLMLPEAEVNRIWDEQKLIISNYAEASTAYVAPSDGLYTFVALPYDNSEQQLDHFWAFYQTNEYDEKDTRVSLSGAFVGNLKTIDQTVKSLSQVFLIVGLIMAVFAMLLFSNFVATSISQKRREIGILRAVGARSSDVFKIFFSESFFIAMICILLSLIGSFITCNLINAELSAGIGASLLVFGPASIGVLLTVAFLTAFLSTILPVYQAAKKKPVDSIRGR